MIEKKKDEISIIGGTSNQLFFLVGWKNHSEIGTEADIFSFSIISHSHWVLVYFETFLGGSEIF